MAKANTISAKLAETTAVTSGTVVPENGTTVEAAQNTDSNVGHNNPPVIVKFVPTVTSEVEAIHNIETTVSEYRAQGRKLGTIMETLTICIADYAFFMSADGAKVPSFKALKSEFLKIAQHKRYTELDKETGTLSIKTWKKPEAPKVKGAKAKAVVTRDPTSNFMGMSQHTFTAYVDDACKCALLILMGSDSTDGSNDGTTYRKGLRYSTKTQAHNIGDVVYQIIVGDDKQEYRKPFPLDSEDKPEGTYVGVIYNDHKLHPNLVIEGTDPVQYIAKSASRDYKNKPWLGMTIDGLRLHYLTFIGAEKTDAAGRVSHEKAVIVPETGMAVIAKREAGGTQTEGSGQAGNSPKDALTGMPVLKLDTTTGPLEVFQAAIQIARNLPKKDSGLTEKLANMIADLHRLLDENISLRDEDDSEYMADVSEDVAEQTLEAAGM